MVTEIWVNIGSGNGLLSDSTKPLPELMFDWPSVKSSDIHIRAISQEMPQPSITKIHVKNYISKTSFEFPRGQWVIAKAAQLPYLHCKHTGDCGNWDSIKISRKQQCNHRWPWHKVTTRSLKTELLWYHFIITDGIAGSAFIKPDKLNPWIKDQI